MSTTITRIALSLLSFAPAVAGQGGFTEVTNASGIVFSNNQPQPNGMAVMCGGAAAGDLDGDGWVDLFVTGIASRSRLFRNLGTDGNGVHLGFEDVAATSFSPAAPGPNLNGVSIADVDGDQDLDLMVTGLGTVQHFLWINDGNGHFTEEGVNRGMVLAGPMAQTGFSSSFGDYDLDGYLDLYVAEWGTQINPNTPLPSNSRLLRNQGANNPGYFEDTTDLAGVALEDSVASGPIGSWTGVYSFTPKFADFNNDGWPDLAIAGDFTTSRLYWNQGDGTFVNGTVEAGVGRDENGMGAAIADFNGDGNLDWFVTSIYDPASTCSFNNCNWGDSGNRLYLGNGQRKFTDGTDAMGVRDGGWGWGATEIDFNNDGRLDLAMTNGIDFAGNTHDDDFVHDASKLWMNDGARLEDVSVRAGIRDRKSGKGIVRFDYDQDGDQDLFITNVASAPVLYRNDVGSLNEWLQLDLRSSAANSRGIGAHVLLWPNEGDNPLLRIQSASSNYLSQNETLLQFGLGQDNMVRKIEVTWPGGAITTLENIPTGQRLVVQQP